MDAVFPVADAILPMANGAVYNVHRGQHWSAADPVVAEHPHMFSTDPRYGLTFSTPPAEMADPPDANAAQVRPAVPVERATAAPGEARPYPSGRRR